MPVTDLLAPIRALSTFRRIVLGCALVGAVGIAVGQALAPASSKPSAPVPTPAPVLLAQASGPQWQELTATQREILKPLMSTWNTLTSAHKNKWIALSQNY